MRWYLLLLVGCATTAPEKGTVDDDSDGTPGEDSEAPIETETTEDSEPAVDTVVVDTVVVDTLVVDTEPVDTLVVDTGPLPAPAPYGANLLLNPGCEAGDLSGWDIGASGGDGWAAIAGGGRGGFECGTSYGLSLRSQDVDLLALGFTEAQLDAEPEVHVSEWFREICLTGDTWRFEVLLRDGAGATIASWQSSGLTAAAGSGCDYSDDLWFELAHVFTGYGPGLRSVVFRDGGGDVEFWAGHYGIRMDDAWLSVEGP